MADTPVNLMACGLAAPLGTLDNFVLGAAKSGARALDSTHNGKTFSVKVSEGVRWEIRTGCTYTDSNKTLTRGTLEESSTGVAQNFSTAAIVQVVQTAAQWNALAPGFRTPVGLVSGDTGAAARANNAAILQALFAIPGKVTLPAGDFCSDPFTITASVRVEGQGANNAYGPINTAEANVLAQVGKSANTILRCTSATAVFITVTGLGCEIGGGIHFVNSAGSTPTAGSAIQFGNGAGVPADGFKLHDCSFSRFFKNADVNNAVGYTIHDNLFFAPVQFGLAIANADNADEGDPNIYGNWFCSITNAASALYFKGGGGLKITGNKFWRDPPALNTAASEWFQKHIWIDNPTGFTSVMTITGNSFEAVNDRSIYVDCSTAGGYNLITITGNEFAYQGGITGGNSIELTGRSGASISAVHIAANVFSQCVGVKVSYCDAGTIGLNTWMQPRAALITLGLGTTGIDTYPQTVGQPGGASTPNGSLIYFQDLDATNSWAAFNTRGNRLHKYTREVGDNANSEGAVVGTYVQLFQFRIPAFASARMKLAIYCSSIANGQATMVMERMYANESAALTAGIIGTDYAIARVAGTTAVQTVGASITNPVVGDMDVSFTNVTVASGDMAINVLLKLKAGATGTGLKGIATIELDGAIEHFQRGP